MKSPLNRGGLRFFLVLIALARGLSTQATILAGIPFILLGTALHFWSKGCLRQNQEVTVCGPYRFVRHPFYLGNALVDTGVAVMSGCWPLQALLPFWWLAVYLPVMRREEDRMVRAFGLAYESYQRRVPRLIPWRCPSFHTAEGFRWDNPNIAADHEVPRTLRLLAYPLLFFVCTTTRAEGWTYLATGIGLAALAALGLLYVLAWELSRTVSKRKRGLA
jgi:hypothetical protein